MPINVNTDANNNINIDVNTTQANASVNLLPSGGGSGSIGTTPLFGPAGNGIASIELTSTSGLVDTYTITFTNGNTTTFNVTNGQDGTNGNGISSIELTSTSGLVDTYTITFTDGNTTTFNVTNGQDGNGIASIQKTSTSGLVDTYTITFDNGNTETFTVTNGQKGDTGSAATISVGSTTTGAAGTSASVTNSGTSSAAVLDFVIPRGAQGETGATGADGYSPTATVTKSGDTATITITDKNGTTTATVSDGSGASSVSQLTDVDLTNLADGDVLVYDSTSQEWKAEAQSGGGITDVEVNGTSVLSGTVAEINLATVATSGSYNDLTDKPTIGNGTVTFTQGGVTKGTITMNQSGDTTIALEQGSGSGTVTDVEVNGESVVTDGVAEIDLTGYQEKLTAGTDLEIIAGSGAILPDTYEELEYIQSDGDCYIDTGIVSNLTDTIEQKFQKLGTNTTTCAWFGSMQGNDLIRISIGSYVGAADQQFKFLSGFNYTLGIGTADTNEHVIKLYGGSVVELDGTSITYTSTRQNNPTVTSYLFARHGYDTVNTIYDNEGTRIFYHKQKRISGTELLDLVPARRIADGKLGFYNLVNNTFLTNSGSGTLTGGNVVTRSNNTVINFTNETGYITGISSSDVTTALGYTPYNASNPNGYTSNVGTVTSVNNELPDTNGNVTIQTGSTPNDGVLTITQDNSTLGTFTANQSTNTNIAVKGLYDYYTINANIVGTPTISDYTASDFTSSNYVQMRETLSFGAMPWEWWIQFTTGTIPTLGGNFQFIFYGSGTQLYLDAGNPGNLGITLGSVSTSFGSLSANTTYKVRIITGADKDFNSASVSNIYLYNENDSLLASTSVNSWLAQIITPYYGVQYLSSASSPFNGSINFENSYINQIDTTAKTATRVWTGIIPIIDTKADYSRLDGQWVTKDQVIASNVSFATGGSETKTYNLTNYLPDDGATYEVLFSLGGQSATTSGSSFAFALSTDIVSNIFMCRSIARTAAYVFSYGNAIVPLTTKQIKVTQANTTSGTPTMSSLRMCGYRRVGTNS